MKSRDNIFRREVARSLAVLFVLFNVGLPIVVASCPMMKDENRSACRQCIPPVENGTARIIQFADRSCCLTIFAAERNTVEFVKSGNDHTNAPDIAGIECVPGEIISQTVLIGLAPHGADPPNPLIEDIPLFVSSLLI